MNFLLRVALCGVVLWACCLLSPDVEKFRSVVAKSPNALSFVKSATVKLESMVLHVCPVSSPSEAFSVNLLQPAYGLLAVGFLLLLTDFLVLLVKRRRAKERRRLYVNVIRDNVRRVEDIAAVTALPFKLVQKELRKIVKKGKGDFKGAYFNEATQEVVLARDAVAASRDNAKPTTAPDDAEKTVDAPNVDSPRTVLCNACGASVTIVGDDGECEYCGSRLQPTE